MENQNAKGNVRALALVLFLSAAFSLTAAEITGEQAARAAAAWVRQGADFGKMATATAASATTVEDPGSGAKLHVVKMEGGGFVVTSADDLVMPVIAFSPTGDDLDTDDGNPLWALLRGDIAARQRNAAGPTPLRAAGPTASQRKWAALLADATDAAKLLAAPVASPSDLRVDSFVRSRWNQSTHNNYASGQACYNYYTPSNYVCGCVATMTAQIMRYWQWPTSTVAAATHPCKINGNPVQCTMMGGVYDWSAMPLVPANGATEAQRQAIGKLAYDIGASVGMNWGANGSGASLYAAQLRLVDTFGYANGASAAYYGSYYPYSLAELQKVVIPNCDARSPVGMSVFKEEAGGGRSGHAVLVDGYGYSDGDFYMHVNCGWGGSGDAWYCPPDFPTGSYTYTTVAGFIFNLFPERTGSIASGRVLDADGGAIAGAAVVLKRGSTQVGATTTDENGIYAFIVEAGSYVATATADGASASLGFDVGATTGTSLEPGGYGSYYPSTAVIGNTYGNDIALTGVESVAEPVFSPESCLFYPSTNVTIACATEGATIRYTLDGTPPTETNAAYSGAIEVSDDTTIKARAFKEGLNPSAVASATYTYDTAAGAPKGDFFADPIEIAGEAGTRVIADNSAYTVEPGEPWHTLDGGYYYYQYRTVWYRWTAPGSGTATLTTHSSGDGYLYPTYIAVYTGDELGSIQRVAFSTEHDENYVTTLAFEAEQGTTYRIVGMLGFNGSGSFTLTWSGDFATAQTATATTPVPVPYSWLDAHYPGQGSDAAAYEALGLADSDGDGFPAWAEYVANSDPTNAASRLVCEIAFGSGTAPTLSVRPAEARPGFPRIWQGKAALTNDWGAVGADSHFFRVIIEAGAP